MFAFHWLGMITFDAYLFGNDVHMFYMLIDILILSCSSFWILWAPWAQDPGPWLDGSDGWIGRTDRTDRTDESDGQMDRPT
jgi:hypothetical protein